MFWLYILFGCAYLIQLFFWAYFFQKLQYHPSFQYYAPQSEVPKAISVIICAKNEAGNLEKHLPRILNQSYSNFEVLVVDDGSTDNTPAVLHALMSQYNKLHTLRLTNKPQHIQGKKWALQQGIKAAAHDWLLLTDADCVPASPHWIQAMQSPAQNPEDVVLGFGPYHVQKGFLNRLIRYETLYTALQYGSFTMHKQAYMGVGRNMLYHKHSFRNVDGFQAHAHIQSGDDDLFIQDLSRKANSTIKLMAHADSLCTSVPAQTYTEWFRQKSRHVSTATHYTCIHQILLASLSMSHFIIFTSSFVAIILGLSFYNLLTLGLLLILRAVFMHRAYHRLAHTWHQQDILRSLPLLDLSLVLYYITLSTSLFKNRKQWH